MASIPCAVRNDRAGCVCDDNPLNNISMELTDGPYYIGYAPTPPIYQPQPGNATQPQVPVFCISTESQLAADQCADNATVPPPFVPPTVPGDPLNPPPQPPDTPPTGTGDPNVPIITVPPPPVAGYWNTESNCIAFCPDHSSSATASIPAHTIFGSTQAEADMLSSNACIALAQDTLVCFTPPSEGTIVHLCEGVAASLQCVISGTVVSIDISGLPPGMTSNCTGEGICQISGSPSSGNYTVTVTATTDRGINSFDFFIYVLGVTCPATSATNSNPYSDTVSGAGGTAPYTFTPITVSGLTLDAAGNITGIPTSCPTETITIPVTVQDAEGYSCTKNCNIPVTLCECPDWSTAHITNTPASTIITLNGGTVYGYSAVGAFCYIPSQQFGEGQRKAWVTIEGAIYGTPDPCKCNVSVDCIRSMLPCGYPNCIDDHVEYVFTLKNVNDPTTGLGPIDISSGYKKVDWNADFRYRPGMYWILEMKVGPADFGPNPGDGCCGGSINATATFSNIST